MIGENVELLSNRRGKDTEKETVPISVHLHLGTLSTRDSHSLH